MKTASFANSFNNRVSKVSDIFNVDYQRGGNSDPQKRAENQWLNDVAQKRAAAAGAESAVYAVASD